MCLFIIDACVPSCVGQWCQAVCTFFCLSTLYLSCFWLFLGDVLCAALLSDGVQLTEHLSNQVQAASIVFDVVNVSLVNLT